MGVTKPAKKIARGPFQTLSPLVHTDRDPGASARVPSQEASGQDRSACLRVGQTLSASVFRQGRQRFIAGWSSPVARQAHNLKVIGSNPIPATRLDSDISEEPAFGGLFHESGVCGPPPAGADLIEATRGSENSSMIVKRPAAIVGGDDDRYRGALPVSLALPASGDALIPNGTVRPTEQLRCPTAGRARRAPRNRTSDRAC
jgi:hypothetical protein